MLLNFSYLQCSGNDKHRFDGTKTPIVVILLRQQFSAQGVQRDEFSGQQSSFLKAFSNQHDFANQLKVGDYHRARSEQSFQVFGKLT